MIGLDSNILVRYFAQDDSVQSRRATQVMESRLTENNLGYITAVAMIGTIWVLERTYRLTDDRIAAIIEWMLQADVLAIENEQEVFTAMSALKEGRGSFADALIGALGAKAGCSHTLTFDRKALRLPDFTSP